MQSSRIHHRRRRSGVLALACAVAFALVADSARADPPHTNDCARCHKTHGAPGGSITTASGNFNLCASCHISGGLADSLPLNTADQALAWPGLPAGTNSSGTSHRWDAGVAGRAAYLGGAATASSGQVGSAGAYTGAYSRTYVLTITASGNVGAARFTWNANMAGGGATNVLTAASVALGNGLLATFRNGSNGVAFQSNDTWHLYVRSDLRNPADTNLLYKLTSNTVVCSTCHNEHSQAAEPYDRDAPAYGGSGTGSGRHYLRIANDEAQMCNDCHGARYVTNAAAGSHPVNILLYSNATYSTNTSLPLAKSSGRLTCMTCHTPHSAPVAEGSLLRTNLNTICLQCHTLGNTVTPCTHLNTTNNSTLWPGSQYGGLFPQRTNSALRGTCVNCHFVHGWPNPTNTANRLDKLTVDLEENLCFTCHDSSGPAVRQVKDDFAKLRHHPVADSEQRNVPEVECTDCHNPHQSLAGAHVYTNTATAARNQVSNPLRGVSGVTVSYNGLGNFEAPGTNLYTATTNTGGATYEYEICFKCHTAYAFGATPPPNLTPYYSNGSATFTPGSTTVTGSGTIWNGTMVGSWIFSSNNPTARYRITAVNSTTSLTITPAYQP